MILSALSESRRSSWGTTVERGISRSWGVKIWSPKMKWLNDPLCREESIPGDSRSICHSSTHSLRKLLSFPPYHLRKRMRLNARRLPWTKKRRDSILFSLLHRSTRSFVARLRFSRSFLVGNLSFLLASLTISGTISGPFVSGWGACKRSSLRKLLSSRRQGRCGIRKNRSKLGFQEKRIFSKLGLIWTALTGLLTKEKWRPVKQAQRRMRTHYSLNRLHRLIAPARFARYSNSPSSPRSDIPIYVLALQLLLTPMVVPYVYELGSLTDSGFRHLTFSTRPGNWLLKDKVSAQPNRQAWTFTTGLEP